MVINFLKDYSPLTKIGLLFILCCSYSFADISGKVIAYGCYSCHGEKLINPQAGSAEQLTDTLLAFKYNQKRATIMDRISKGFSDTELKAVARYLSHPLKPIN